MTGAGLTLCSKSRSTSRALFTGLLAAVTYISYKNRNIYYQREVKINLQIKTTTENFVPTWHPLLHSVG